MDAVHKTTIALCGANGYIGSALYTALYNAGFAVITIGRDSLTDSREGTLVKTLKLCDAVINVAGAPINHRWSPVYKQILHESRVGVTKRLVNAIAQCDNIKIFINASAIGIYPSTGTHNETDNTKGRDYLSRLCQEWESEALRAPERVRTIITRFGIVLSPRGQTYRKLALSFRLGLATKISTGLQPFTWIALNDLTRAMLFLLQNPVAAGIYNLTAPEKISNGSATKLLAKRYKTWMHITIRSTLLRLAMGESADLLLNGQTAPPKRLLEAGFVFQTPDLTTFLNKNCNSTHHLNASHLNIPAAGPHN